MAVWEWAQQHTTLINVVLNTLMVLIWVFYLQVFLVSFMRQRRSVLHIDLGAASDETARCIVTNMGSEPIYIAARDNGIRAFIPEQTITKQIKNPWQRQSIGALVNKCG